MNALFSTMKEFSSAEEFLDYFAVPYEQAVVNVKRLHILQRFHQYLRRAPDLERMEEGVLRETCRGLLVRAYEDLADSSAAREKVFKVFRDADGVRTVSVESLREALPRR